MVFRITGTADRGTEVGRRLCKPLVRLPREGPGVEPADVSVLITVIPPGSFSFAGGTTTVPAGKRP